MHEISVKYRNTYIPAQATVGPSALDNAPSDRNIPITFPFSSPSPTRSQHSIMSLRKAWLTKQGPHFLYHKHYRKQNEQELVCSIYGVIQYSVKIWQDKTLANQSFQSFGEDNVGKFIIARVKYWLLMFVLPNLSKLPPPEFCAI